MNYHMKKIGILGGTFNPVHTVHLQMAEAACDQYDLDEVWFMPSNHPPHKEQSDIVSNEHRQRMIQFAIDGCKNFAFRILNITVREPLTPVILFLCCRKVTRIRSFILLWVRTP